MKLDENAVREIAGQLGLNPDEAKQQAEEISKKVQQGKSEGQLVSEILKLKKQLEESNVPKEKQIEALGALMPMMKGEQKTRLAKLIELIDKN